MFDVAIIGAGLAGLTCAQQLHSSGYDVVIVEKSRGVGGRLATRRLYDTCTDHGVRYLEPQGKLSQQLIERLIGCGILQVWTDQVYSLKSDLAVTKSDRTSQHTCYISPTGMTAVAKFLATGLKIWQNRRVQAITLSDESSWHLTFDSPEKSEELRAKAVVVAIPAPQALILLEPLTQQVLPPKFLHNLRSVEFDPCLSAIAGYSTQRQQDLEQLNLSWNALTFIDHPDLDWIGLDSSKRPNPQFPIFVVQSTAEFAKDYLETTDLQPASHRLLSRVAQLLIPWLDTPDWVQVHRWRYAFPRHSFNQDYLTATTPLPIVCCGDWCGGNRIESALISGVAAAREINSQLQ